MLDHEMTSRSEHGWQVQAATLLSSTGHLSYFKAPPTFARIAGGGIESSGSARGRSGQPTAASQVPLRRPKPSVIARNFVAGCTAACGAVTLTNPWDMIRTRLELQGELAAAGRSAISYRGALDAFAKIIATEGPLVCWAGPQCCLDSHCRCC